MQRWLFDVKTIFGGNGLYQCPRARDEQSGAVAERAHRCAGEYLSAARAADRQYSAPGTNPIEQKRCAGRRGDARFDSSINKKRPQETLVVLPVAGGCQPVGRGGW